MLVITRRVGETIRIGDDVQIRVCARVGTSVRLGIDAPRDVPVHRVEVYERVLAEQDPSVDAKVFASRRIGRRSRPFPAASGTDED
jgi:carbon storage regulator